MRIVKKLLILLLSLLVIYLIGVNYAANQINDRLNTEFSGRDLGLEEAYIIRFDKASRPAFNIFDLSFKLQNVRSNSALQFSEMTYASPIEVSYNIFTNKLSVLQSGAVNIIRKLDDKKFLMNAKNLIELDLPIKSFYSLMSSDFLSKDENSRIDFSIINSIKNIKFIVKDLTIKDEVGELLYDQKFGSAKFSFKGELFEYNEKGELFCNLDVIFNQQIEGISIDRLPLLPSIYSNVEKKKKFKESMFGSYNRLPKDIFILPTNSAIISSIFDSTTDNASGIMNVKTNLNLTNAAMPDVVEFTSSVGSHNKFVDIADLSYLNGKLLYDSEEEAYNLDLDLSYNIDVKFFDREWIKLLLLADSNISAEEKESTEFFLNNFPDFTKYSPIKFNAKMNIDYHPQNGVKSNISSLDIDNSQYGLFFTGDANFKGFKQFISNINIGIRNHENFVDIYKPIFNDSLSTIFDMEVKIDSIKFNSFLRSLSSTQEGDLDIKLLIPENIQDVKLGPLALEELLKIDLLEKPVE